MDSRGQAYYHRAAAAAAAAAAGDATDGEEPAAELAPKAVRSKKKLAVEAQGGAAVRDDLTCPECGKVFMSDKAMYGHLRSHPLRKHKGAARLAAVAAAAADDASVAAGVKPRPWKVPRTKEEAELGDDRHPGRSPVTGKRGRPASSASSSGSAPAPAPPASSRLQLVITEEEEAAMTLLDIASGRSLDHQPTQPAHVAAAALPAPASHQMPSVDVEQGALAVAEHRTWEAEKPALVEHVFGIVKEHVAAVAADAEPQSPEAKTPVKLGPVTDQAVPVPGDKNDGHADMPVSPVGGTTKKPLKRRLQDVETKHPTGAPPPPVRRIPSPASKRKYECSECHKTFSTHQALGGHVAAHKRQKKSCAEQQQEAVAAAAQVARHNFLAHQRPAGVVVVVDATVVAAAGGGIAIGPLGEEGLVGPPPPPSPPPPPPAPAPAPAPAPQQHQCLRCPMVFPTGQALGGHMRKHFLEAKEQEQLLAIAIANASAAPAPPPMMANDAPTPPPPMANGAGPVPPPIAVAPPPAPPIAGAAPPPPMANGAAAAAPPGGNAAPPAGPQPDVNMFDLNELPNEDAGENQQP
uniref:C2H2-type domain-containing protein n=1 Tax=Oryza meridionalis TaxID=40149 RepID=A0A0E0DF77_9ORYZ